MVPAGSSTVTHSQVFSKNTASRKPVAVAGSDGARVFVTDGSGDVAVFNASTGVEENELVTQNATGMATFGPFLYAAGAGDVEKFNPDANTFVNGLASGVAVALSPDGLTAFVPSLGDELQRRRRLAGDPQRVAGAPRQHSRRSCYRRPVSPADERGEYRVGQPGARAGQRERPGDVHGHAARRPERRCHGPLQDARRHREGGGRTRTPRSPTGRSRFPPGRRARRFKVQVDNGSGQATTATESFQVKLTSSSGDLSDQ